MDPKIKIVILVAMADNNVIGAGGRVPWHISEDLCRFKRLTMGHPIILGRKTYESIGKPLPGRLSMVLTRNPSYHAKGVEGVEVFSGLMEALAMCEFHRYPTAFIIGGGEVYREALSLSVVDSILMTEVHQSPVGDTHFDPLNFSTWRSMSREDHEGFSFVEYVHV